MTQYADFEIGLHRRGPGSYAVEMAFRLPGDDADHRETAEAQFDFTALRALESDLPGYGRALGQGLFAAPSALAFYTGALAAVQQQNPPIGLRVRLLIGLTAGELHALRWEALVLPQAAAPVSTSENAVFSRYLASRDWRPVRLRSRSALKALVAVAAPSGVERFGRAPVDAPGEIRRAQAGLGSIPFTALPAGDRRATLANIAAALRSAAPDILYLVCHGALVRGMPQLMLEDEQGQAKLVDGADLAAILQDLTERPRLAVLLSCQSAGTGTAAAGAQGAAMNALGPRLAEAGVPAVIAMQGNFSMDTAARFFPVFFTELARDGQIDRALAAARGAVRDCPDFYMPVLYSRLTSGQIWYVPRFSGAGFDAWQALNNAIVEKRCTPVLGPGVVEAWLGQPGEIARRWAEKYRYPLAPDERDELPRVAQYINRRDGLAAFQSEYYRAIRDELLSRAPAGSIPEALVQAGFWTAPQALKALSAAAEQSWDSPLTFSHRLLADLRLPIYITTCADDLLAQALRRRGAKPQVRLCPWWGPADEEELEAKCLYSGEPTEDEPLVYHLYGHLGTPASLVVSEDNYFDFLIGYIRYKNHVPPIVRDVLMSTSLLFLGFRTDDWGYRVLFRSIIAQKGAAQFHQNRHVNAQVEPDEGRLVDTRRALRYLEDIFTKDNIAIYWGKSDDFMGELAANLLPERAS